MRSRKRPADGVGSTRQIDAIADGMPLPPGEVKDPADVDALRAAIELNAARPAADLPSEDFVARLRRQLTENQQPAPTTVSRRVLLTGAGAIAAGVVGVVADRVLLEPHGNDTHATTLDPDAGVWMRVASRAELGDGKAHRFETATAVGFVSQNAGTLIAVSGACTHQGCLLQADGPSGRLDCPCHRTSFGYDGDVLFSQLSRQPAPLPRITVRDNGGGVEVFVPGNRLA
jgi:cytochrome b6-f complex iron-sulfur subunit